MRRVRPSRPRFGLLILHTQAESVNGAYSRYFSRFPRRLPFTYIPPCAIGSVPSLSGNVIAYRWRSLPRVRPRRASSPQGSSSKGCRLCRSPYGPINVRLSFSHTHHWYEVSDISKVSDMLTRNPKGHQPSIHIFLCV